MSAAPTARSRVLALLGDPVSHSLSPTFQNAALRACGLDAVYVALRCDSAGLPGLLRGLALAGGAGNVTVPHKELAARSLDRPTSLVERTGACNTFWGEDGAVCGDNTDVEGFARAVRELLGRTPAGARVLLLGAGGAAGAALCALVDDRADEVVLLNRTRERAEALRARHAPPGTRLEVADGIGRLSGEHFDLVVNSTSLGLRDDDPLPLAAGTGPSFTHALDLVYSPGCTRWVRELRAEGVRADDGLGMLLHQGAAAFARWWGREAPLEAMRAALELPARPE